jgi:hypothetical protein
VDVSEAVDVTVLGGVGAAPPNAGKANPRHTPAGISRRPGGWSRRAVAADPAPSRWRRRIGRIPPHPLRAGRAIPGIHRPAGIPRRSLGPRRLHLAPRQALQL